MAFSRAVFLLVVSVVVKCVTANQVPVYLWGDVETNLISSNPLSGLSTEVFRGLLKQEFSDAPFTVVFVEETLSVEDLRQKNADGETSYPYLNSKIGQAVYLPSVEAPLEALTALGEATADHVKLTENGLSADLNSKDSHYLFIYLNDAKEGESRAELLRRHDEFMQDMFTKLSVKHDKVAAAYTARNPSWTVTKTISRTRRAARDLHTYALDNLLLDVKQVTLVRENNTVTLPKGTNGRTETNGTSLEATIDFGDYRLNLFFTGGSGYWFFDRVVLTDRSASPALVEELQPTASFYAFEGFSYRCGQAVSFASVNASRSYQLNFEDIKLQAFTGNATAFGESLNCVGFFSAPIWSCLFVVFILLAITFYGIMMMMDIRAMDRFDDPKGKTITINTSE